MFTRGIGRAALAIAVVAGMPAAATADRVDLVVFEGGPFAGLDIWLDLVDRGSQVDFVFRNDSSIDSSVVSVYIEDVAVAAGLSGPMLSGSPGVNFTPGATPPEPPGSISSFFTPWAGNLFSACATPPLPAAGVNPGGQLTIAFDSTASFSDMLAALRDGSGDFRVVAHVIDLPGGESVWVSNVPAPGAVALLGLAGLAATRRRR
jgi:MYXO-CTERM domain-containing protein